MFAKKTKALVCTALALGLMFSGVSQGTVQGGRQGKA